MRGEESIRKKQVGMKHPFFKQAWLPVGARVTLLGQASRMGKVLEKTGRGDIMEALRTNVSIQCIARELGLRRLLENEASSP